ncbi:hypothetical protein SAMN02744124_03522 [Paenibacillus barengoltzii J12]|uniref:Uncharacterized protein n=2 Tax=Paenibacillus barengoltzii TaxID=343517 RepID=R9L6L5_9BACL|nr:hypothetical protein C812_03692 [Paenibacillus barengoltzii G22]SMF32164.1 hypothetical protein SAMN02744102_02629 [Paenibacillus barengoltzii]SMF53559.1 hypothetical protein SAMN02744124_03522 [Paenibacillus barengoltzii J12]
MVAYLCGLPLEGCLWGEVASFFVGWAPLPFTFVRTKAVSIPAELLLL